MNDFLIYAARLQDAGISSLWISLGSNQERTRLMHVSPDASTHRELAARFPTRTFYLDGTDPTLVDLKDCMAFSEGGPTAETIAAACVDHPLLADDLREWFADWTPMPTDSELEAIVVSDDEVTATAERMQGYVKGLLRGMDSLRERTALSPPAGSAA